MKYVCPLEITATEPRPGLRVTALLTSIDASWGETDFRRSEQDKAEYDPARDLPAPVIAGIVVQPVVRPYTAVEHEQPDGPRIVVIGSATSFADTSVSGHRQNLFLLANSVNWLAGKTHMLGVPPKNVALNWVTVPASTILAARWVFIGGFPALFVVLGVFIWVARRR
jgi:hypothetical protein